MFVFYNASNFIDGVNGLYASIIIFWIISFILITKLFSIVLFIIVLSLLIFLYFNLRNKVFGNSGNAFLSCFVGSLYIFEYNKFGNIYCDEILFLFLIPGLDMIRMVIERLFKGKSPLEGDNRHLHHLILNVLDKKLVWILNLIITIFPIVLLKIIDNFYYTLIISTLIYFSLIFYTKKI